MAERSAADGSSIAGFIAAAAAFETDVSALLSRLPPRERETLARIVSRLLVTYATDHGIDLFATAAAQSP